MSDKKYPWIMTIDPYGDTTFNPLQWPHLISEFNQLQAELEDKNAKNILVNLIAFLKKNQEQTHTYIKFIGVYLFLFRKPKKYAVCKVALYSKFTLAVWIVLFEQYRILVDRFNCIWWWKGNQLLCGVYDYPGAIQPGWIYLDYNFSLKNQKRNSCGTVFI